MAVLHGARSPHVRLCTLRLLCAARLALHPFATIYDAMYNKRLPEKRACLNASPFLVVATKNLHLQISHEGGFHHVLG